MRGHVETQFGLTAKKTGQQACMLLKHFAMQRCLCELCQRATQVRGHVETQIGLIAKGQADKDAVVAHTLQQFRQKFLFFVAKVARMDALFEASFSPLASSGQPLHKVYRADFQYYLCKTVITTIITCRYRVQNTVSNRKSRCQRFLKCDDT